MIRIFMLFLLIVILFSCDPYYDVEYKIVNQTDFDLTIISSRSFVAGVDTNSISDVVSISLYGLSGLGRTTEEYLEEIEELPFDTLIIRTREGKIYKLDPLEMGNWDKRIPARSQDPGSLDLVLRDFDF